MWYYRKFIPNLAKVAKPLTVVLKTDQNFIWTQEQSEAFDQLKSILVIDSILQYPQFDGEFIVTTDSSKFAIGAVLSQGEEVGKDVPISYISRTLNQSEINYSTTEKEPLAIQKFRPYL
jgi:uncharacterized linocin/CFP29 family protein